jgi:hypothetical protein
LKRAVNRQLARVGNGWGCDEKRSECVNESVVVDGMVWWRDSTMRRDEMKTQGALQRQHHCALL